MFRFRNVDVSNVGPFDSKQLIYFTDGLTLVAGENGTGKTTIVKTLRREHEGSGFTKRQKTNEASSCIVFFDDNVQAPCGGTPWTPLISLMSTHQEFITRRREFENDLTKNVQQLLRAKIESRSSKFLTRVSFTEQLQVRVVDDGTVAISTNDGEDIIDCFQAMGERLVLYLSINAAVRKLLSLDLPFVVDSQLGYLDRSLLYPCYQFIVGVSQQTIVFENGLVVEMLGLKPHFQIVYDRMKGKSIIEKITGRERCA
jgi:hypothetical protein